MTIKLFDIFPKKHYILRHYNTICHYRTLEGDCDDDYEDDYADYINYY